jgi:hypothetical protein
MGLDATKDQGPDTPVAENLIEIRADEGAVAVLLDY